MVCVVPGVLYDQILEQTAVNTKEVVYLVTHLLSMAEHDSCPTVPSPWYLSGEEVLCYIFQTFLIYHCRYFLVKLVSVRRLHIYIEVSGDEELLASDLLVDLRNDALQDGGIVQHYVASHHVPAAPACHYLEAGDVRAVMSQG